jgi:hypothetical protein
MTHTSLMKICFETFNFVAYFTTLICIFCFLGFRFSQFCSLLFVHLNLCFSRGEFSFIRLWKSRASSPFLGQAAKEPKMLLFKELYPQIWLAQNGFSPMKKIASSENFSVSLAYSSSSSSEGEEDYEERKEQVEGRGQFDMWSSISYPNGVKSQQKKDDLL